MIRRMIYALLIVFIAGGAVAQTARADGMILPESSSPGYLVVRSHHVNVIIEEQHASTTVEQVFHNPHAFLVSGHYFFPVPPEAMISTFSAVVDGVEQNPVRQSAAETNAQLFAVVAERHDPSLLQYADWESMAFDITLAAGESQTMRLNYEEVLAPQGGMLHYRYVLSTERYSAMPVEEISLDIDLTQSAGLGSIYAASHDATVERLGEGRARVTWEAQNSNPDKDFELFFAPAEGDFGGGLLSGNRAGTEHFLFLFAPESESVRDDSLPKDIVFIIDRSGSMSGNKIEQARNALHFILAQLNPNDRYSIVGFDDRLNIFAETLQAVESESLAQARQFVDRLSADGSTDLEAALDAGLGILENSEDRPGATRLVVFLTDGLPTAGITDETRIAKLVAQHNARAEARIHVFGVGYDVNTHLLDQIAAENRGSITYVQPDENLELVLSDFYSKIANPVLTDLEITFEGIEARDMYPQRLPDLFSGSSLLLSGRYSAAQSQVSVRVRGFAGSEPREYVYHFDLDEGQAHDFVPRLWATRRIGELLDRVRVEGESAALIEEIRGLGLTYGLVTPYTTFAVAAQQDGAASMENMSLYSDSSSLNRASGETTIQARVQNQAYQDAERAEIAYGDNISNYGENNVAQVTHRSIDLSLLNEQQTQIGEPITDAWIDAHIKVDRQVAFGSDKYFELAKEPALRGYLQSSSNVLFPHAGEVIEVVDSENVPAETEDEVPQTQSAPRSEGRQNSGLFARILRWLGVSR